LPIEQFLYTPLAFGLSVDCQEKLREIVDGRGMIRGGTGQRTKWADLASLLEDLASPKHERTVGLSIAAELRAMASRRGLGPPPGARLVGSGSRPRARGAASTRVTLGG